MTYTKKTYEEHALIISQAEDREALILDLAELYENDNPLFNREKFINACG